MFKTLPLNRFKPLYYSLIILLIIILFSTLFSSIKFIYNNTDSLPRGLYYIYKKDNYLYKDIVCIKIPLSVKKLVSERNYLPAKKSYFLKPIVAMEGDSVCVDNWEFSINNESKIKINKFDSSGRPLPKINFCKRLSNNQIFLASLSKNNSFDSRYFGPVNKNSVLGVSVPLWILSDNNKH